MKFKLTLLFILVAHFINGHAFEAFTPVKTIDGVKVEYGELGNQIIEPGQSGSATAIYNEQGAYILYDLEIIEQIPDLAKFLILEHERAHHRLGHSLYTKINRELMLPISSYYYASKEKDADCEAGYVLREKYGNVEREEIKSAMAEIIYALEGRRDIPLPSWLLYRIDVIDVCKDGVLLQRPKPVEQALDIRSFRMKGLTKKPMKRYHGPNCWNSALYTSGLSHQVRFTSNEEFHHLMESPYCETLETPEAGAIKVYRVDLPLVQGSQAVLHAAIWLDTELSFNKMTALSTSVYKFESHRDVDSKYGSLSPILNFPVVNQSGERLSVKCHKQSCKNIITYKKCRELQDIEEEIVREDFKEIYYKILKIERKISSHLFDARMIASSKKDKLLESLKLLEGERALLSGASELENWQVDYLKFILLSLREQLTMRQPNWLSPTP